MTAVTDQAKAATDVLFTFEVEYRLDPHESPVDAAQGIANTILDVDGVTTVTGPDGVSSVAALEAELTILPATHPHRPGLIRAIDLIRNGGTA